MSPYQLVVFIELRAESWRWWRAWSGRLWAAYKKYLGHFCSLLELTENDWHIILSCLRLWVDVCVGLMNVCPIISKAPTRGGLRQSNDAKVAHSLRMLNATCLPQVSECGFLWRAQSYCGHFCVGVGVRACALTSSCGHAHSCTCNYHRSSCCHGYCWLATARQVYDSFFSSHRMVGMVASLEALQRTWRVLNVTSGRLWARGEGVCGVASQHNTVAL